MELTASQVGQVYSFPPAQENAVEEALLRFNKTLDEFIDWVQGDTMGPSTDFETIPLTEVFGAFRTSLFKTPVTPHKKLRASSIPDYERVLFHLESYCRKRCVPHLDPEELAQACVDFTLDLQEVNPDIKAPATMDKWIAVVRRFLRFVMFHYATKELVIPEWQTPDEPLPIAFDDAQVKELLFLANRANHPLRVRFFIIFFLATGVRRDEFRHVRRQDVNLNNHTVTLRKTKNGRVRVVPFTPRFSEFFGLYFEVYGISSPKHYIYGAVENPGRKLSNSAIDDTFHRLAKKMKNYSKGDPVHGYHLHCLRHTYATHLLRKRVQMRVISQLLGHTSMRSTTRYTALNHEQLRYEAADGLRYLETLILGTDE